MYRKPADLALEWGCSERALRKVARDIGACHALGKAMWFNDEDVAALLAYLKAPPKLPVPLPPPVALPDVTYNDLVRLRKRGRDGGHRGPEGDAAQGRGDRRLVRS